VKKVALLTEKDTQVELVPNDTQIQRNQKKELLDRRKRKGIDQLLVSQLGKQKGGGNVGVYRRQIKTTGGD